MFVLLYEYETMTTHRHIQQICTECKSNQIYYDSRHDETFCNNCGLILQDTRLKLITDYIQEEKKKEMNLRKLWHRRIQINRVKIREGKR